MAKVKVQEATRILSDGSGKLLEDVSALRRNAQETLQSLKRMERAYLSEEAQRQQQEMQEEQQRLLETQSRAWTMPDEGDEGVSAVVDVPEGVEPVAETPPEPVAAKKASKKAVETVQEVPAEAVLPGAEEAAVASAAKEEKKETPAKKPKAEATSAVEPAEAKAAPAVQEKEAEKKPAAAKKPEPPKSTGPKVGEVIRRVIISPTGEVVRPGAPKPQPQPQGQRQQYGRSPQGGPARPYGQSPQGGPARPYGQSPQGGQARPYGQQPRSGGYGGQQGGYNNQGGAPRPGGGPGRPGFGGQSAGGPARRPGGGAEMAPAAGKERVSNYDPNRKSYQRNYDQERGRGRGRVKETGGGVYDEFVRGGGRRKNRKPSAQQMMEPIKIEKAFMTAETITVKDLTERLGKPAGDIIKKLLMLGTMATINQELDFDTAQVIAQEYGINLELKLEKTAEDMLSEAAYTDAVDDLVTRPPVVTIMGHVDHGKTSLLDYIRNTRVTAGEAGGITQHIGAYTVQVDGRQITFLDTPGHEAFTSMRARGTQATDIAILVVAADDGVMPQTIESINHARAANVPIIVAINKIDKPDANLDRIKQDLTRYELVPEDWGGDTIVVPVSALTGEGVDNLLENILLLADVQDLKANPDRKARGVIIEAKLDKGRGPVATVLVQNGTLHTGDTVVAGTAYGRIRAMMNDKGERVKKAGPSMPIEIIGFNDVPDAGDELNAVEDERLSRMVAEERLNKQKAALVKSSARVSLDDLYSQIEEGKVQDLNVIIKADVQGSVEAVKQALEKLSNEQVRVRTIHSGVGAINENDVMLANIDNAIIVGFNVRPDNKAREAATRDNIDMRLYRVIYQAIEDVENAMKGMLEPVFKEVILGHAEVRNVFKVTGSGTIAGSYVTDGKVQRNAEVRLLRDNIVIFEGKLDSLRRFKDDVKEVASGFECGIGLEKYNDIKEGDVIECFVMEEIER